MESVKEHVVMALESTARDKTTLLIGMNEILTLTMVGYYLDPAIYGPIKTIITNTMKKLENKTINSFENVPEPKSY